MIHPTATDRSDAVLSTADAKTDVDVDHDATAEGTSAVAAESLPPARATTEDRFEAAGVVGSAPDPEAGEAVSRCPVCAFGSHDPDDVYAHLLTAHRKSTLGSALLDES
jgi:hypothetical protein